MSQTIMDTEFSLNLQPAMKKSVQNFLDSPCPACGQVCPNDAYCINCGYIYDPLLKKYLKYEAKGKKNKEKPSKIMENRNIDGSYNDLPSNNHTKQHALLVKLGKEYKLQNGKTEKIGGILRQKNHDGSYNKGSVWYIYTKMGWIRSPSKKRKPTESQIKRVCENSNNKTRTRGA